MEAHETLDPIASPFCTQGVVLESYSFPFIQ